MKFSSKFKQELDKLNKKSHRRWLYFCWTNKIDNIQTKFSKMSKEEFMQRYAKYITKKGMELFKSWENTEEYLNLYNLMLQQQSNKDLYKIYKVVRDKALKGDDKAVKTFLLLKKEINKSNVQQEKSDITESDTNSQQDNKDDLDITED